MTDSPRVAVDWVAFVLCKTLLKDQTFMSAGNSRRESVCRASDSRAHPDPPNDASASQ